MTTLLRGFVCSARERKFNDAERPRARIPDRYVVLIVPALVMDIRSLRRSALLQNLELLIMLSVLVPEAAPD